MNNKNVEKKTWIYCDITCVTEAAAEYSFLLFCLGFRFAFAVCTTEFNAEFSFDREKSVKMGDHFQWNAVKSWTHKERQLRNRS